jgi:2'-5' RNA ligase
LEDNLSRIKIRKEKRNFSPHITIARIKDKKNIEKLINNHKMNPTNLLDCPGITLFESRLKPHGAEYIILGSYSLK